MAAAMVAKLSRFDVILAIGHKQGKRGKASENGSAVSRAGKTLQELLENQAGDKNRLAGLKCARQRMHRGERLRFIPAKSLRPDAGVDEKTQRRSRSAL